MSLENVLVQLIEGNKYKIQESQIPESEYWHSTIINKTSFPISAGYANNKHKARKIAIAECIERMTVTKLLSEKDWGFETIPTACGFAAGFDLYNTRLRSIKEAVERWVMSKWIDEGYFIEEVPADDVIPTLSSSSHFLVSHFDRVLFFKKKTLVKIDDNFLVIEVAQTMGLKGNGIYPGSSAQDTGNGIWEHALIESFRHFIGVKNNPKRGNFFPDNKIYFFSENSHIALKQINKAYKKNWPLPKIKLHKHTSLYEGHAFVARTIIDGWQSWNNGPLERFLY